jgi:uncharacterized membrane protein YuzA (DUF378 family)
MEDSNMAIATSRARRSSVTLAWIAFWVMVIGGLNWGLVGLFRFDLVAAIFGEMSSVSRIIYVLVGVATVYSAIALPALIGRSDSARVTPALTP